MFALSTLACLLTLLAPPAQPAGRLLAVGWDNPTPAQYRAHVAEFAALPFDGAAIAPTRATDKSKSDDATFAFCADHWQWSEFASALVDLKNARASRPLRSYLMIDANPGNVDWFDDAGWKEIVDHWRLLARLAKQSELAGLCYDSEAYTPPYQQFAYLAQAGHAQHSFADYCAQARLRGRQVMRAVAAEYPRITIYTLSLLAPLTNVFDRPDRLTDNGNGLAPAFVDGWLDELPPTATIVEGDENAYTFNRQATFDHEYVQLRCQLPTFVSPENRAKLRNQYRISHGIYLDAFLNPRGAAWFIDRGVNLPADRLATVVGWSLAASDGDTWIYGEQGRWWASGRAEYPLWDAKMPRCSRALRYALDPTAAAVASLADHDADLHIDKPSFVDGPGAWWSWQPDTSHGKLDLDQGAAHIAGCREGCWVQAVNVKAGAHIALSARVRTLGAGTPSLLVEWQDEKEHACDEELNTTIAAPVGERKGEWLSVVGAVVVPDNAHRLVVLLTARDQGDAGQTWFDDVRTVAMLDPNVE